MLFLAQLNPCQIMENDDDPGATLLHNEMANLCADLRWEREEALESLVPADVQDANFTRNDVVTMERRLLAN
jgi:hypothetical protein